MVKVIAPKRLDEAPEKVAVPGAIKTSEPSIIDKVKGSPAQNTRTALSAVYATIGRHEGIDGVTIPGSKASVPAFNATEGDDKLFGGRQKDTTRIADPTPEQALAKYESVEELDEAAGKKVYHVFGCGKEQGHKSSHGNLQTAKRHADSLETKTHYKHIVHEADKTAPHMAVATHHNNDQGYGPDWSKEVHKEAFPVHLERDKLKKVLEGVEIPIDTVLEDVKEKDFPFRIKHKGATHVFTGKIQTHKPTGKTAAEYKNREAGTNVWRLRSGEILESTETLVERTAVPLSASAIKRSGKGTKETHDVGDNPETYWDHHSSANNGGFQGSKLRPSTVKGQSMSTDIAKKHLTSTGHTSQDGENYTGPKGRFRLQTSLPKRDPSVPAGSDKEKHEGKPLGSTTIVHDVKNGVKYGTEPELKTALGIKEDVDQLDEISKQKLGAYIDNAGFDVRQHVHRIGEINGIAQTVGTNAQERAERDKSNEIQSKRQSGIHRALAKLTGKAKVVATEEVDEILNSCTEEELVELDKILESLDEKYVGFDKLAKEVGSPALAAWIGRKKYGKKGETESKTKHREEDKEMHAEGVDPFASFRNRIRKEA